MSVKEWPRRRRIADGGPESAGSTIGTPVGLVSSEHTSALRVMPRVGGSGCGAQEMVNWTISRRLLNHAHRRNPFTSPAKGEAEAAVSGCDVVCEPTLVPSPAKPHGRQCSREPSDDSTQAYNVVEGIPRR